MYKYIYTHRYNYLHTIDKQNPLLRPWRSIERLNSHAGVLFMNSQSTRLHSYLNNTVLFQVTSFRFIARCNGDWALRSIHCPSEGLNDDMSISEVSAFASLHLNGIQVRGSRTGIALLVKLLPVADNLRERVLNGIPQRMRKEMFQLRPAYTFYVKIPVIFPRSIFFCL